MFKKNNSFFIQLIIGLIGLLLFLPFLGRVHLFDWDEINFAEAAREMIASKNYLNIQIDYLPFWEKPPLFIWMQVFSMKIFGITEFAARLPNAICGVITLLVIFNIGKKIYNREFGLLWVLSYAGAILPFFYFKSGIIDPWFNLFIFLGIYFFTFTSYELPSVKITPRIILSALFIGLGILTKGPVAFLVFFMTAFIFWILNRFKLKISFGQIIIYLIIVCLVGGLWFIIEALNGNFAVIKDFILYQVRLFQTEDSGHGGFLFYHFVVLFVGVLPSSIIALQGFRSTQNDEPVQRLFRKWMLIMFWFVLILFTIVKTKILHYSSLCYFPLTFLTAYVVFKLLKNQIKWKKITSIIILIIGSIIGLLVMILPLVDKFKNDIIKSGVIKDPFAAANLQANPGWSGYESLLGVMFIVGLCIALILIKKKNIKSGIIVLFTNTIIFMFLTMVIVVPKIEAYTQKAAIEFYQSHQDEDCYIKTIGFKSYAHLFYGKTKKQSNINSHNKDWQLTGKLDKKIYFVTKIDKANELTKYPQIKKLYAKNGFVFFMREPEK